MSIITRNLQLFWRAERILAESRIKLMTHKAALAGVAGIAVLFAAGMFNVAGYFALEPSVGKAWAAFIVGAVDIVLAGLLIAFANSLQPGKEEDMVREVRDMAVAEIGAEVQDVQDKLIQLRDDVEGMRVGLTKFLDRPMDVLSPSVVAPIVMSILRMLRTKKS